MNAIRSLRWLTLGTLLVPSFALGQVRRDAGARTDSGSTLDGAATTDASVEAPDVIVTPPDVQPPPRRPLKLMVSAGIYGQFSSLDCRAAGAKSPFERVASQLRAEPDAFAFDGGELLGSAAQGRLAVEHDVNGLAEAVASTGLKALVIGSGDLGGDRAKFLSFVQALSSRHVPYILSNLECEDGHRDLCDSVNDSGDVPVLFDTPAGKVAIVSVMYSAALESVAHDRSAGLHLADPKTALIRATAAARAAGADFVIGTYEPVYGNELRDALAFGRSLEAGAGPDMLLVPNISGELESAVSGSGTNVQLIATRSEGAIKISGLRHFDAEEPGTGSVPAPVESFVGALSQQMCGTLNRATTGGVLKAPLEFDGFANLMLDVIRDQSFTEIAIINKGAISNRGSFPLQETITRMDLFNALPYENFLRVARVSGAALAAFATAAKTSENFYLRGLTTAGGVKVNGRAIDPNQSYLVVTTDYVAEGGDGGIAANLRFTPWTSKTLQEVLLGWLDAPHQGDLLTAPRNLTRRTRWTFRVAVDAAFTWTTVDNPQTTVLTDAQLSRAQSIAVRGDMEVRADADHPEYTWENAFRMRYGAAQTIGATGTNSGLNETSDLIYLRSTLTWRPLSVPVQRWYAPQFYADSYLETEFTKPDTRAFHHLELRPTAGLRFQLLTPLSVYAGFGFTWEMLATPAQLPGGASPIAGAVNLGYLLKPTALATLGGRPITVDSSFDVTLRDPWANLGTVIRFHAGLAVPIFSALSLSVSYDLFAREARYLDTMTNTMKDVWGWSGDLNVGLQFGYTQAAQAFSF